MAKKKFNAQPPKLAPATKKAVALNKKRRPAKRAAHKPKRSERVVGPLEIERIGFLWMTGRSHQFIADEIGCSRSNVQQHIDRTLKPLWASRTVNTKGAMIAKIHAIEQVAWDAYWSEAPAETRTQVKELLLEKADEKKKKKGKDKQLATQIERVTNEVVRNQNTAFLNIIQWCVEQECKIDSHYAAKKLDVNGHMELRAAGMSPTNINNMMLDRVQRKIMEQAEREREYAQASAAMRN